MSLVYITYHNENIADMEKHLHYEKFETQRYKSKHKGRVHQQIHKPQVIELETGEKLLTSSKKCLHKTMGYAETPLNPPCKFLRKQAGIKWRRENEHVCPKGPPMPPVPRYERPKTESKPAPQSDEVKKDNDEAHCPTRRYFRNHKHRANFVALNIERMKTVKTRRPAPRYVDTPHGDTHHLLNTGLIPQYICTKNFGKVPCYLRAHKQMLQKVQEECKMAEKALEDKCMPFVSVTHGVRKMTPEERQAILTGLKTNFADRFKTYQSLSLYTDTMAKKLRKGKLESDLRVLEQDIFLMENNPVIFISEY